MSRLPSSVLVAATSPTTNAHIFEHGKTIALCGRDIKGWPVILHPEAHGRMWCSLCMDEAVSRV